MSGKQVPDETSATASVRAEREARLAQALRDNLKRRKAQQRARVDDGGSGGDARDPGEAAGDGGDAGGDAGGSGGEGGGDGGGGGK